MALKWMMTEIVQLLPCLRPFNSDLKSSRAIAVSALGCLWNAEHIKSPASDTLLSGKVCGFGLYWLCYILQVYFVYHVSTVLVYVIVMWVT